ncbi:twin-arginine translocation pathway signal [Caenimonas koreensis DSM 17982]|uniref:Twin-arginine translocation pathway signal n=1 Tax=Caenimonas koreensis DSM 17982 TaxID=1121255 RepID=A0A844APT1_9BURK|nr:alpha/beta fold hydrolase [Caenimonas koreensis]MRD46180.1 twin-arginine translocation pathway signal [Caenimonas koreensis DSM 17982]
MISRRLLLALGAGLLALAGCATAPSAQDAPPIVFVHGNGDTASIWQTTMWRFESNGWPRSRLYAIDVPYPIARDDDARPQAGRTSAAENAAHVKAAVEQVLQSTGAKQVVLFGNSRGGIAIRSYVESGGGDKTVSHAILGGTPNHGVWAVPIEGLPNTSEFAGHGPILTALNRPKNAQGDEVTGPVKWMTIRSDNNDKFAQPDGLWVGKRGVATGVTNAGPELKGATNVVIPRIDHRETAYSPAAFAAAYQFITGKAPATSAVTAEDKIVLRGKISGLGVSSTDPASGAFSNNLPLPGAKLQVFAVDSNTGERRGAPAYESTTGADGMWGPFNAAADTRYEFVLSAPGYATSHIYRSAFARSSDVVNIRAERIADADKNAPTIVRMTRPRGYLDPGRDKMVFDSISPPPGAVLGAGVATSTLKPAYDSPRAITAEFNGERIIGRTWPAAQGHITTLELTY